MEFKEMNIRRTEDGWEEWRKKIKAHLDNQAF